MPSKTICACWPRRGATPRCALRGSSFARPTLVTVFLALVLLAGTIAGFNLVKQQLPNYDVPSIQVLLTYSGASTTEMRDAIVRPLEDQIAGAPDLSYMRDRDPTGTGLDRRGLRAELGPEHRSRSSPGARAGLAAPASQRSAHAADLDLQSQRSGRRLVDRVVDYACARRPLRDRDERHRSRDRAGSRRLLRSGRTATSRPRFK